MKILVVDVHPVVRMGLRIALEAEEDVGGVDEAPSARRALDLVRVSAPDIVTLDLVLKGSENGLDLCRKIKSLPDPPRVIVYTGRNSQDDVISAKLSKVDSFVHKGEGIDKLIEAIRETHLGKKVWFLGDEDDPDFGMHHETTSGGLSLTPKEKEVFTLLVKRRTNAEIAADLSISRQTVKNHVSRVLKKLGARSRNDLW